MSTYQYQKVILSEISKLNDRIDLKILRGRPYRKEARRHKTLLEHLNYIEQTVPRTASSSRFFSFFL